MGINANEYYPVKEVLSTLYGAFRRVPGYQGGYVFQRGFRGYGKVYHLMQMQGYEKLVAQLIRYQLRYPYWAGVRSIRAKLLHVKHLLYSVDVNSWYPSIYVDTDSVTRYNGL